MTEDSSQKLEIDWLKTVAGALAAVSSAVLLSTLGAAGTIIGAALGSVIATVGGAVYSAGLARSRDRLAEAQTIALRRVGVAQAEVRRASRRQGDDEAVDAHLAHADERLDEAISELDALEAADGGWRRRLAALPWKRIALLAAGLFAVVVVAITLFEAIAGKPVSSITGGTDQDSGTSISRIGGSDGAEDKEPVGEQQEPPSDGPGDPSQEPAEDSPTAEPTDQPTVEPSDADPTSTPSPSEPTLPVEPSTTPTS